MNVDEQSVRDPKRRRHQVIPRTLVFLTSTNPATAQLEVLLLKGAPDKRLWANRYNGLGGHVEADEDVHAAARREVREETGIEIDALTLRGVVHIDTGGADAPTPGIMLFVFRGESPQRALVPTVEGTPEWVPADAIATRPLVDDLYELIPRTLGDGACFYAHYRPRADGTMEYRFT